MRFLNYIIPLILILSIAKVNGQGSLKFIIRQVDKSDSIAKYLEFTDIRVSLDEKNKHKLIWNLDEVRKGAIYLRKKGVETFTMTDQKPNIDSPYYIIGFYEMLTEHYSRLKTFRINKNLEIEKHGYTEDKWTKVRKK